MPRRPARLITELLAFLQSQGATLRDLARELGVDETALIRLRTGERSPSKQMLVKIVQHFGEHRFIRDLLWVHFFTECRATPEGVDPVDALASDAIPPRVTHDLRRYVDHFAAETMQSGSGLYVCGPDASALAVVVRALRVAFEGAKVRLFFLRADQKTNAADVRNALAAPLLIVERVDFASATTADIIRRRADLTRPTIVTSMAAPDAIADPYLRRIAKSAMRRVDLGLVDEAAALPPTISHAS